MNQKIFLRTFFYINFIKDHWQYLKKTWKIVYFLYSLYRNVWLQLISEFQTSIFIYKLVYLSMPMFIKIDHDIQSF